VMFLRHAGQSMSDLGKAPFHPEDLSQWDGQSPGTDDGVVRHLSHQRGKDVDVSLYGLDGDAPWRSYCQTRVVTDGYECVPGTVQGFDADINALLIAAFFESGRVTMCFLDQELIAAVQPAAARAAAAGTLDPALLPLYSDGSHLQHWPNHHDHVHVRVSEEATPAGP